MSVHEIVTDLIKKGARLEVVDQELKISIAKELMTAEVYAFIRKNKEEFIIYLNEVNDEIRPVTSKNFYTTTSAQKRLYFLYEFDKSSLAYNLPQMVRLDGKLDRNKLSNAFRQLMVHHENLRTSFALIEEELVQKITDKVNFEIEALKLADSIDKTISQFIRPFNLQQAPLMRVGLIELSEEEHLLIVDMHHIITDGISQSVLINDFMKLYAGEELPSMPLQYKDYAEWEGKRIRQRQGAKAFWINEFAEELPGVDLPTDFPRPAIKSYEGASMDFEIGLEETTQLKAIARVEKTTLFNLILSVFNILMNRLTNAEDVVIGTTVAGRQNAALENIIGMFVNTIPLRNYPKGEIAFQDFLETVKDKTLSCLDNQAFPYDELLNEIKVERDTSRNPLFDVMFVYLNFEEPELRLPGLTLRPYEKNQKTSQFDLTLIAYEANNQIHFTFEYAKALFKTETVQRFVVYFKNIIAAISKDLSIKINEIEILPEAEKQQLVKTFNDTAVGYPQTETVVSLFQKQRAKTPHNIAIRFGEETLSYEELDTLSTKIATYLLEVQGVSAGCLVGVMLEREKYLIPIIFGILKAGAAYVPIDPHYPAKRVNAIVEDAGLSVLIIRENFWDQLMSSQLGIVNLDKAWEHILNQSVSEKGLKKVDSGTLAYVLYTSGSTGTPKGVMIEHHSVVNRILWMQKMYPITEKDVLLQKTPIVFDVSVWELFWWSFTGASLTLLKPEEEKAPAEIIKNIARNQVSVLHFVPSMLSVFLTALDGNFDFNNLKTLRWVFASGEALKPEQVSLFGKTIYQNCQTGLVNLYGPTEATVDVSYYQCDFEAIPKSIPIGKPIDNIALYILNKSNRFSPIGVPGELCIGGVGLARGYLNNEKITNAKFVENPNTSGERIYRTGDLAMWLPDGNIDFLGRIDHQVKIRGFRIELEEIEKQLENHEQIDKAVVLVKEQNLVAYCHCKIELKVSELRNYLLELLPEYMVPAYFVWLETFPLTINGKLDRKALPNPEIQKSDTHLPPSNQVQRKLVTIWSELLKVPEENISISMNFFDIGGNSLKLIHLTNKVNEEFETNISVANMFKYPVISLLSKQLTAGKEELQLEEEESLVRDVEQRNQTLALLNRIN